MWFANIRKNPISVRPAHRKNSPKRTVANFTVITLLLSGLVATSGAASNAVVTTTAIPDVAGSNTTITFNGDPIREGATLAGGSTIGIGTSALLNPGIGQREIRTKYDSKTVYQAGTARAPEGWTLYYSTNNGSTWVTTEPSPASSVTDIKATASSVAAGTIDGYSQQYSTETSASIPSSTFSASTGGDGWGVEIMDDYIFNIYHHANTTVLECKRKSLGTACATATKTITTTEGSTTVNYFASNRSDISADPSNSRLYAITAPVNGANANKAGVLCIDVSSTPTACGFTPLTTRNVTSSYSLITDTTKVGNRIFGTALSGQNELLCFDTVTRAQCANSPVTLTGSSGGSIGRTKAIGDKIFVKTTSILYCYVASTLETCSGSWPQTVTNSGDYDIIDHNNTSKVSDGVCVNLFCFNFEGVSQSWVNPWSVLTGGSYHMYMRGVTTIGRYFVSLYGTNLNNVQCFDFTTNAKCSGYTPQNGRTGGGLIYEVNVDPENPACLWLNSDFRVIRNFDAYTGDTGCAANPVITLQPSQFAPRYACSTTQGIDQWGNLKISQLVGGGSAGSIKLTVRDPNGNPVTGFTDRTVSLNTDLDMSTMNVALSGSRPTFSFAFSSITGSITSATIALEYKGKGPELCSTAVLTSPAQTSAAMVNSSSVDSVGTTNLYESQRNFNIGSVTVSSNLYLTVPSAPRNLAGTGLNTNATLTFQPPSDNGGLDLGDYQYSLDGGSTYSTVTNLADNGDGTFSFSVSNLTPGSTYSIKVAATNAIGRGLLASISLTAQVVDFGNIPDTAQNAGPIYLATQTAGALPYTYTASPSNVCTVSNNVVTLVSTGTCNLVQNQSGDANNLATTASSSFQVLTNPVVVVAPDAPINLEALPASTQVSLSWNAPTNNGNGAITDYVVQYKVGSSWVPLVDGVSTNTFAVVTGLTNGTTYSFKVAAVNSAGQGAYSSSVNAIPATVPGAPTNLAATKSGTSASLTWTAPSDNGGSAITDYKVEFKLSAEPTWSTFTDGVSTSASASVTGLDSSATYDFRVTAKNAPGFGAPVSTVTLTITGQAAALGLSWAANTDGVVISNHIVEYRVSGSGPTWTQIDTGSTNRTATISSLANGTNYDVRVARITGTGGSATVSSYTSAVIGTPVTTPGTPSVTASAGIAQASVSWSAPAANGSAIYDYVLKYRAVGAASWITMADGVSTATTAVVPGLTNGTEYEFQVAAKNGIGTGSYSASANATPRTVPGAISGLTLTVSGTTLSLSWTAPASDGGSPITDYVIEYKLLSATTWNTLVHSASTNVSGSISGLAGGTRYSVRVAAVNAAGTGSFGPAGSELTGAAPSPSPSPSASVSASPTPTPTASENRSDDRKPVLRETKFKKVITEKAKEKVELSFVKLEDVKVIKIEGKEVPFTVTEGVVTFTDPGLSVGVKDVVIEGSWGTLTFSSVVEVKPASVKPKSNKPTRIAGFAPGQFKLSNQMKTAIKNFMNKYESAVSIACVGSTSGPTILSQDKKLAVSRANAVCSMLKKANPNLVISSTGKNTKWVNPLARSVTLTVK
jgi:hypothetical protein